MNIPVYFNKNAKFSTALVILILLLMPVVAFLVGYFNNQNNVEVGLLCGLFGLGIASATLLIMRKTFLKYLRNTPAFTLKDEAIETSSGNLVFWNWFDTAVVFTHSDLKMLGLRKKPDVKESIVENSSADFNGVMFGFPFVVQFDQFATDEDELIRFFQTKLPVVISKKNFEFGDKINWEKID